jgi:hypothetical protein
MGVVRQLFVSVVRMGRLRCLAERGATKIDVEGV